MNNKKITKSIKKKAISSAVLSALGSAHAATILVDGSCSLVQAIETANTDLPVGTCVPGSGADVIQVVTPDSNITINTIFEPANFLPGDLGLPSINSEITIEGNGLTLTANHSVDNFRMFEVVPGGNLTLRDTTVSGVDDGLGFASGLVAYVGQVTIENSTFERNKGAMFLFGTSGSVISNSVIRHNIGTNSFSAGLQTYYSILDINDSSFIDNERGISGIPIRGSGSQSGAMSLYQSEVNITNTTVSGNVGDFVGAGIIINAASGGPIINESEHFDLSNFRGSVQSDVQITNSTITNNKGYIANGLLIYGYDSTVTLQGSIIAGNDPFTSGYAGNIYTFNPLNLTLDGNNIIGDNGETGTNDLVLGASDMSFADDVTDNLYPLSVSNGQLLHPLKVGSVAIDGNDLTCFGSLNDQEGKSRGIDGDGNGSFICDIGSFEHSLPIMADDAPCTLVNAITSANLDVGVGGCVPGNGHDIIQLPENSTQSFNAYLGQSTVNPVYTFALPVIDSGLTIEAQGSTIQRDVAAVDPFDILMAENQGHLNLIDATVSGANGVLGSVSTLYGSINLVNSTISNNQNIGLIDIFSYNSSVVNSTIEQNTFNPYGAGAQFGSVTSFGGIGFEMSQSTISNNNMYVVGGLDLRNVIQARVENTTISGNTSVLVGGLVMFSGGPLSSTLNNSTVTGNEGTLAGGIYAAPGTPDTTRIDHSIVSGNILLPPPPTPLINSPFDPPNFSDGGSMPIEIVSSNPYLELNGNNIIGQNGDSGMVGVVPGPTDYVPAGPTSTVIETTLANNGGDTLTHLPVAAGPAVDTGNPVCNVTVDQLNQIRPWDGDGDGNDVCDIGAVEFGSVTSSDLIFKDGFDATIIIRRTFPD